MQKAFLQKSLSKNWWCGSSQLNSENKLPVPLYKIKYLKIRPSKLFKILVICEDFDPNQYDKPQE